MLKLLLELFCLLFIFILIALILYRVSNGYLFKYICHDLLCYHIPDHSKDYYMGVNECSVCKVCGKIIMKNSQGNWV